MSRPRSRAGQAICSVLAAVLVAAVAACGDDPTGPEWETVEGVTYAEAFVTAADDTLSVDLGLMTKTESGVWYQDIVVGTGDTAVAGDQLFVRYNGWVRDGTLFEAGSFDFTFFDGTAAIGGFHWGTQGMRVGGERLLLIPPEWAYGNLSSGVIYSGAVLVFDIVLDSIQPGTGA